jgi:hypothetical protein
MTQLAERPGRGERADAPPEITVALAGLANAVPGRPR